LKKQLRNFIVYLDKLSLHLDLKEIKPS